MSKTKAIVYDIEINDKDLKKLGKDISKLDTTINVGVDVDKSELKKLNKQLDAEEIEVKVKLDDHEIINARRQVEKLKNETSSVGVGASAGFIKASNASRELGTVTNGWAEKYQVFQQERNRRVQKNIELSSQLESVNTRIKHVAKDFLEISDDIFDKQKKGLKVSKEEMAIFKKKTAQMTDLTNKAKEYGKQLDANQGISNKSSSLISSMGSGFKKAGLGVAALAISLVSMSDTMKDVADAAGKTLQAAVDGEKVTFKTFLHLKKMVAKQRILNDMVTVRSVATDKITMQQEAQQRIVDDTTNSLQARFEASKKAELFRRDAIRSELSVMREQEAVAAELARGNREGSYAYVKAVAEVAAIQLQRNRLEEELSILTDANRKKANSFYIERKQLVQDSKEQELDWYIDATDVRIQGLLKIAMAEESTSKQVKAAYDEIVNLNNEALSAQLVSLNVSKEQVDILGKLLPKAQVEYIKGLGLSEIMTNRLLEVYKEQLLVQRDIDEIYTTRDSVKAVSGLASKGIADTGIDTATDTSVEMTSTFEHRLTEEQLYYARKLELYKLDADDYATFAELKAEVDSMEYANKLTLAEASADAIDSIFGMLIDNQDENNKKGFKSAKELRLAQTTIAGAAALAVLWATPTTIPEPYGSIAKGVQSVALVANTASQLNTIKSTEMGGSSVSGSASKISTPQISNSSPVTSGRSLLEMERANTPQKAFIVSTELQGHLESDNAIKLSSTL